MQFYFINYQLLFFLPFAVLLPILIHLLYRRKPKIINFSDTRFLEIALKNILPRSKLKQYLLLIMRILMLLFLLFAFSRPVINYGKFVSAEESTTSIVILIDTSLSMQYKKGLHSNFDNMKILATKIIQNKRIEDKILIASFNEKIDQTTHSFLDNKTELLEFVNKIQPSYRETSLFLALNYAYEVLKKETSVNKGIIILSDLTENSIQSYEKFNSIKNYDSNVKLIFVNEDFKRENFFFKEVDLQPDINQNIIRFIVKIFNYNEHDINSTLTLFLENKPQVTKNVLLKKNSQTIVTVESHLPESKKFGYLQLDYDYLQQDNKFFFTLPQLKKIKVVCVDQDPPTTYSKSESFYITQSIAKQQNFEFNRINIDEFINTDFKDTDIIILPNIGYINKDCINKLNKIIYESKIPQTILFSLGNRTSPQIYSKLNILPAKLLSLEKNLQGEILLIPQTATDYLKIIDLDKFELEKIKIFQYYKTTPSDDSKIILNIKTDPLLIEKEIQNKKIVLWTTTIDNDWTNFPAKPFYTPFWQALFKNYAQAKNEIQKSFYINQTIPITLPKISDKIEVIGPNNDLIQTFSHTSQILLENLSTPGIYLLKSKDYSFYFSVNINTNNESILKQINRNKLKKSFKDSFIEFIDNDKNFLTKMFQFLKGKEISTNLFLLSIIIFITETIIAFKK